MSVLINVSGNEIYKGHMKVATASVAPGQVVIPATAQTTVAAPGTDGVADGYGLMLVCNYDSYADTDMTASKDFTVAVGEYARLKDFQVGDKFTTDKFIGTYGSISVGDIFAVNGTAGSGAIGSWIAIASRTPIVRVMVTEKTTLYGENALTFKVIAA